MDDFSALLASPLPISSPSPVSTNRAVEHELLRSPPSTRQQSALPKVTTGSPFSHISPPQSPPLSPQSRRSSSMSQPGALSCNCLENATIVLETVEVKMSHITSVTSDNLLSFQKRILQDCHAILDCTSCCGHSSLVMLLVLIAGKLVISFKRLPSGNGAEWQDLDLGDYKVNMAEERSCVYKALVGLQLARMKSLLKRLWGVTCVERWETHRNLMKITYRQFGECWTASNSGGHKA